jgi:sugar phosphate isomerase/epimerase
MHKGSKMLTRRNVLMSAAGVVAMRSLTSTRAAEPAKARDIYHGLKLGVATYTLRGMKLDPAIDAIQRVGMKYASIKDMHLPMKSTADERKAAVARFKEAGITLLSCGVVAMQNDEASIRSAFEYARDIAVPTIVCNPHPDSFPLLDKFVKEFDIKLAIHNHGPESDRFKSPYDAMKGAERFDERIGVCVDVGHTARMNIDPAEAIRKCAPRLYDVHLKDIADLTRRDSMIEHGRGILDTRSMLQALIDIKFAHHAGIEYEKEGKNPLPGLAESVGYIRGVLSCL